MLLRVLISGCTLLVLSLTLAPTVVSAETATTANAAADDQLRHLLMPEHFDADVAIAALEASGLSARNKIMGKATIDSARTTPKNQLPTALEQIRVLLGLE